MTNELGTTLKYIEAKAERKREAMDAINVLMIYASRNESGQDKMQKQFDDALETIRKYIDES